MCKYAIPWQSIIIPLYQILRNISVPKIQFNKKIKRKNYAMKYNDNMNFLFHFFLYHHQWRPLFMRSAPNFQGAGRMNSNACLFF